AAYRRARRAAFVRRRRSRSPGMLAAPGPPRPTRRRRQARAPLMCRARRARGANGRSPTEVEHERGELGVRLAARLPATFRLPAPLEAPGEHARGRGGGSTCDRVDDRWRLAHDARNLFGALPARGEIADRERGAHVRGEQGEETHRFLGGEQTIERAQRDADLASLDGAREIADAT